MFLLIAAALAAAPPAASPPPPVAQSDPLLDTCLRAQKPEDDAQVYVNTCYTAAYDRAEAAINTQLDALWGRMAKDGVADKDLHEGIAGWHVYRDKWCRFEGAGEPDPGSRGMTELMCRVELTQRLLRRLRKAYQR